MNRSSLYKAIVAGMIGIGLIAAVAYFSSPPEQERRTLTGVSPGERPPDVEEGADVRRGLRPSAVEVAERSVIQRADPETGELEQEFFYERLTPREEGVFDMVAPEARLYLSPTRVIRLQSRTGRFVAPDNHPQSGQFTENVRITLYQTQGERLDLSADSPHRVLQIELDEAEFDTVLGEIRSGSDVLVTTPATDQVEFAGRGLTLLYNELERRIEYMRITHGRSLRYRAAGEQEAESPDDEEDGEPPVARREDEREDDAEATFYRLTFEDDIVAESAENRIEADQLVAFFSLARAGGEPEAVGEAGAEGTQARRHAGTEGGGGGASPAVGRSQATGLTAVGRTLAIATQASATGLSSGRRAGRLPTAESGRTSTATAYASESAELEPPAPEAVSTSELLAEGEADELVMTWTGSMVMTPIDFPPPQMAGADDVYVQFEGRPVRVGLAGGEALTSRTLRYSERRGEVDAIGSDTHPMTLTSPEMGRATAARLTVHVDEGRATLAGAGSIRSEAPADGDEAGRGGLPEGFRARWSQQADFTFSRRDDRPSGIESADFIGDVHIRDEQFELYSETLTTRFARAGGEGEEGGSPQLREVEAEGDVAVSVANGSVAGQWLRVETEPDGDGGYRPSRLLARGDVRVVDERQEVEAGRLIVVLGPAREDDEDRAFTLAGDDGAAGDEPGGGRLAGVEVRQIEAEENVRLLFGEGMTARGDAITADAINGEAHLRGEPVVLARYEAGEENVPGAEPLSELRVAELFLEDEGRLAYADGPGEFAYVEPAEEAGGLDQRIRVNWSQRMQYDDATQTIDVRGNVIAEAEDGPAELNRLTSRQVILELVDPEVLAAARGEEADAAVADAEAESGAGEDDEPRGVDALSGRRQLHRLIARGDAVLLGTRWADAGRDRVLTRFRAEGPELTFDNIESVARVEGAGSLLIEDYRPVESQAEEAEPAEQAAEGDASGAADELPDEASAEASDASANQPAAPLSGRGATLFTWTRELELNEAEATMVMDGGVRMTHRPTGRDDVVELRTEQLVGDMKSMRGMRAIGMTEVESMEIDHIAATGDVQLRDAQRMITAGQMIYDGPARTVLLRAADQRNVQVIRFDEPRPLRASEILWNLERDRLEILDADL